MPLKQTPYLYSEYQEYKSQKRNKVFPALIVIKRMMNGDARWNEFEIQLETLMDKYSDVVKLSFMGFPNEWKKLLK